MNHYMVLLEFELRSLYGFAEAEERTGLYVRLT
jgi:hypothetical protein